MPQKRRIPTPSNDSNTTNPHPLKCVKSSFASIEEHDVAIIPVKHTTLYSLEQQRKNSELCDVILQVEDKEFPAHRTVLVASSEYFLKMFTVEMKEKYSKKVPIKTVTATAMSEIQKSIFFHGCEVALTSHICYPIRLVFHQHLNLHVAYPGIPPESSNTHEGNFYTCHRTLFSDYSDLSLTTKSPERRFSTSITLALPLAQPHCASITKHGHHV